MADSELSSKLSRQQQRNDGEIAPAKVSQSVYSEFKEFSIPEIKEFRKTFQKLVFELKSKVFLQWNLS